MIDKIALFALNNLQKHNVSIDDPDLWLYGARVIIRNSIIFICSLILSMLFGFYIEYIIFNMFFMLCRQITGGYHAKSAIICFIQSTIMIIVIPFILHIGGFIIYDFLSLLTIPLNICMIYLGFINNKVPLTVTTMVLAFLFILIDGDAAIINAAIVCDLLSFTISMKDKKSHA